MANGEIDVGDPQFNSGVAYLQRINTIMNSYVVAYANSDFEKAMSLCEVLYSELYPRLKKEERLSFSGMELRARQSFLTKNPGVVKMNIRSYYNELNSSCNALGLLLQEKKSLMDNTDDED
jgi:hypothetical protein